MKDGVCDGAEWLRVESSYRVEDEEFRNTSGPWWLLVLISLPIEVMARIPDPSRRAVADSFLTSEDAEP
jgi:hypothetical protein